MSDGGGSTGASSSSTAAHSGTSTQAGVEQTSSGLSDDPATSSRSSGGSSEGAASSSTTSVAVPERCSVFAQDCPQGFKCNPYSNDGDLALDDARCVPVVDDPDQVGEVCELDGNGQAGLDSCDVGALCSWMPDGFPTQTLCIELCSGSEAMPRCATDESTCFVRDYGEEHYCFPNCDPLGPACSNGWSCLPSLEDGFVCGPYALGELSQGEPCEYASQCEQGLLCAPAAPSLCGDPSKDCCLPFCDLGAPNCPGSTVCEPWYDDPPAGNDHVGVCRDPR